VIKPTAVAAEKIVVPGPKTLVMTVNAVVAGLGASAPFYGGLPRGFQGFSGHGVARPFGNVLVGLQYLPSSSGVGAIPVTNGSILMTTVRGGDQIRLSFTGTNQVKSHDAQSWSWTGTVQSGTGRFLGAAGTFFATGTRAGNLVGNFKLTVKITFNPPV
jgi:hypothetical protein